MESLVQEYLAKEFGGRYEFYDTTLSIGTTATEGVGGDGERAVLGFINLSVNTVYAAPIRGAASTKGITLNASGGIVVFTLRDDFVLPSLPWSMVATGASSSVYAFWARRFALEG